jgi:predicted Zn-dependent protease
MFKRFPHLRPLALFALAAVLLHISAFFSHPALAGGRKISFIRDAEIENTIREYSTPLFRAAGLQPGDIKIYLVKDNSLNAFVAGGQRIFINTGLLAQSTNANQVIGVIAHETGHIEGGHLSRSRNAMKKASAQSLVAMLLGGAAVIAGQGNVGTALIMGGRSMGTSSFLSYSRTQEASADQAAFRILDATGQSARGMKEFFELMERQEALNTGHQDSYMRTHPLNQDRIKAVDDHLARSPYSNTPEPKRFRYLYARMKAKLYAYLNPLGQTLKKYKKSDNSLYSRYARAMAYYRVADLGVALPLIDGLIAQYPNDPYFNELKGQMLFDNGRGAEALKPYEAAVRLLPTSALIRSELAQAQLEMNDPALLPAAVKNLNAAIARDRRSPFVWNQLAIAYGRMGDMGQSALAQAEGAILQDKKSAARYHAGKAEKLLPRGSIGWFKAADILQAASKK